MDEDDSQDELINCSTSHSKGKRAALWAISGSLFNMHTIINEEEEGDAKAEDGAFGIASADVAGMSSDEDTEKCPICLNSFSSQPVATPENCEHYFCLDCILAWAKNANSCPVDRIAFNSIYLRKCYGGKVKKMITVQKPAKEEQEETVNLDLEQTSCEVCGGTDREDRLLLCDGCDAGYHMECLTPPLDSVPVEEWFCPECEANNRGSAEELSDTESLPSTARPATSRLQSGAAGPTRAIARTQQSERVRANVNRHRITQARTSQLAPTYMIQSTWLDETINAVVAGLNSAVYIRDLTPRVPSSRRRKRRKVGSKKTSSAKGKTGKLASKGVKRRKRRVRKTKSRKKLMLKKAATPRSRIASNLRIVKDKKSSSLPTVYRPSEHTLSSMRADIGAASLSIYGDPFDLDPFEEEQQAHITSLLEAKRRGISRSALRSHQPVARPVTASLSGRGMDVPQSRSVFEAAPVPDLLGSILSGQSVLLMDSSDVVINRDGSLKATKPSKCVWPEAQRSDFILPLRKIIDAFEIELFASTAVPSINRPLSQSSSRLQPYMPSSASHAQPSSHSDLPPRGHPSLQPPRPIRPTHPPGHQRTNGVTAPTPSSSTNPSLDSSSKSKGMASSQSKTAPTKPMWVDVSVLPRIPKIKRENGSSGSNRSSSSSMNSLAGDQVRQQSVDQQKGRADGQAQRQRPDGASSSSAFSNSFSSSSSTGSSASQPHYSSSSSTSSSSSAAVSFRINASGNSWQSRRLSSSSSSAAGGSMQAPRREKEDEAKKRQLRRDKQMLLASRTLVQKDQDSDNIYDPCNPTLSESSSSDDEAESTSLDGSSLHATREGKAQSLRNKKEEHVKVEKDYTRLVDTKTEKQTVLLDTKVKKEPGSDDAGEAERFGHSVKRLKSETADTTPPVQPSLDLLKTERGTLEEESGQSVGTLNSEPPDCRNDSSASNSAPTKKKETKSDSKSSPKSRDLGHKKKAFQASKERRSSSPETDRGRREDRHASGQGGRQRERERDRETSSRRLRSRERRSAHSESSPSGSPDRTHGKRRRSRSKDRRRSRSGSGSSSKERSRKKHKRSSKERNDGRERDHDRRRVSKDKRHGWSRSKSSSNSRSRSRSRSKDHKRRSCSKSRSKSRSRSRERRKDHTRLQQSSLSSRDNVESRSKDKRRRRSRSSSREKRKEVGSSSKTSQRSSGSCVLSSKDTKRLQDIKKEKDITRNSLKEEKVATVNKPKTPSCTAAPKVRKKGQDFRADDQATTKEMVEEMKVGKEIKKEKASLDMFEDSFSFTKPIKKEETDVHALMVAKSIDEELNKEDPIKTEAFEIKTEPCEIPVIKTEPSSPEICHLPPVTSFSTPTTPVTAVGLHDTVSQSRPAVMASREQPATVGLTVPVKQELRQPSDSDDDFNVDVMLDNLDYVKSERTEESGASVKREEEVEEGKNEQVSTVVGAKSKTQVKRVTWNIQEPQGPQPEKSASSKCLLLLVDNYIMTSVMFYSCRQYLKKLHMQERAIEEVKLAIKPFYQRRDINKDEYKEIVRKAVQKVCHSKSGEINPVKVGNLVKAYVDKYKHARKHKKGEDMGQAQEAEAIRTSGSP
uniref:PHD and ring finger domains 1 n=1 Tax=Sander lucioperca TaxID=283035 RepID=A0A8D0AQK9_SANLU